MVREQGRRESQTSTRTNGTRYAGRRVQCVKARFCVGFSAWLFLAQSCKSILLWHGCQAIGIRWHQGRQRRAEDQACKSAGQGWHALEGYVHAV